MQIEIRGKTHNSVRISVEGKTFETPTKKQIKVLDVAVIPDNLKKLEAKEIISIKIK